MNSIIRRHGGKKYLAQHIVRMFPPHTRYIEPYFGSGAVLFQKSSDGITETINDLDKHLTNFWKVLQHEKFFEEFARRIQATPFSEFEFEESQEVLKTKRSDPEKKISLENAIAFFISNRQSRQGMQKNFATPSSRTRRKMNEQCAAWLTAVERLPEVHARLKRVEIRCLEAVDFIRKYDSEQTAIYADPPYPTETRRLKNAYQHEMTKDDHTKLLDCLTAVKGKFIISTYASDLYESYSQANNWNMTVIPIDNKASSAKKKEIKYETLYYNF